MNKETFIESAKEYFTMVPGEVTPEYLNTLYELLKRERVSDAECRDGFRRLLQHPGRPHNVFGALMAAIRQQRDEIESMRKERETEWANGNTSDLGNAYISCILSAMKMANRRRQIVDDLVGEKSWLRLKWIECCENGGNKNDLINIIKHFNSHILPQYAEKLNPNKEKQKFLEIVPE